MQGCGEHAVGRRLPTEGFSHHHEAVTHNHHFIDLQDLLSKEVSDLQVHLSAVFINSFKQHSVVWFWKLDSRE